VAHSLIERQTEEILAQHRVAATRLGLLAAPHTLVLGGGVLRARHPGLHELVVAGARAQAPQVEISVPTEPPVVGAALLALDTLASPGVGRAVEEKVRAAMRRTPAPANSPSAAEPGLMTLGN
jgi:hypothetical protein